MTASVDEIIRRIEVQRSFSELPLLLTEQSTTRIADERLWTILTQAYPPDLERLGIDLSASLSGLEIHRQVSTGNIVGAARIGSAAGVVSVTVEPKLPADRLMAILDWLEGSPFDSAEIAEVFGGDGDLTRFQVKRCIGLIDRAISAGSIRGYQSQVDELQHIRGKPNFPKYFMRSVPLRRTSIECRFGVHTVDTIRNQVFKCALIKCIRVLGTAGGRAGERAGHLLYSLSAVTERKFTGNDIASLTRALRKDASALLACRDVICNLTISPHPGHAKYFFSYAVDMARLFERYCRKLFEVALAPWGMTPSSALVLPLTCVDKEARLDGLFEGATARVLLECKYKALKQRSSIRNPDLYQTVAYSTHGFTQPTLSFLAYPALASDEGVSEVGRISEFRVPSKSIDVIQLDLKQHPEDLVKALRSYLEKRLGE